MLLLLKQRCMSLRRTLVDFGYPVYAQCVFLLPIRLLNYLYFNFFYPDSGFVQMILSSSSPFYFPFNRLWILTIILNKTTEATCTAGTVYPSEAVEFTGFWWGPC